MSVVIVGSLLHFLWQGALIGALAWVAMKLTRTPQLRYVIGVVALALMAAAPVLTATRTLNRVVPGPSSLGSGPLSSHVDLDRSVDQDVVLDQGQVRTRNLSPGTWDVSVLLSKLSVSPSVSQKLLVTWLFGVVFLSLRLCVGWWTARRLTRVSVSQPRLEILSHAERIMGALKIQGAVTVLESALVKVPMTMGWWKPVVLLPAAAMTGLSLEQIDALVAHELAHVRRHDYLVNLAQSAIETLLFYHPAVWLVSRAIRHERELCCDDIALEVCGGDSVTYASALADLEQMRVAEPALAANGGSLLVRVKRILGHDAAAVSRSRTNWSAGVALLSLALVLLPINAARPKATPLPADAEIVSAETSLGDGFAPLIKQAPMPEPLVVPEGPLPPAIAAATETQSATVQSAGQPGLAAVAPADYKFLPLDVLDITVTSGGVLQADFNQSYGVGADGSITVPLLGRVVVAGQTAAETSSQVRSAFVVHRLFTDPIVQVTAKFFHRTLTASERAQLNDAPASPGSRAVKAQVEYEDAYRELVAGRYDSALTRFQAVLSNYPDEAASNQAQFQVGEIYLITQRVQDALLAYSTYINAHPKGWWIADAYYKRAKCYQALRDVDKAAADFQFLIRSYPNSTWVPLARASLAQMPGAKAIAPAEVRSPDASIFVLGEVKVPNVYPWREGLTVAQAISLAGGAKGTATRVELLLDGRLIETDAKSTQGLPAGASVNVLAFRSIVVRVTGAVNTPGNVTIRDDKASLPDILTAVGGLQRSAGPIVRVKRAGETEWVEYQATDLLSGKVRPRFLSDGDAVDVPVAPRFYVQGFVNSPGDLQWEENMSLERALLRAGGVTKDGAVNRVTVKRLNRETKKYEEMNLGKDPMAFIIQPDDVIEVPKRRV